jgi:hypothetical protein
MEATVLFLVINMPERDPVISILSKNNNKWSLIPNFVYAFMS